ncbi:prephenate dehydrogenase [Dietzia cinnamea]|uniref:Prephenate dehydrogenase n=1 Tax=Dietzia cinnamea TaxID=321318 RepID=A0AAW5QBC9_9ACTN|nr:prephenate dehydrogenase [Dietzia cinnamea]MCT1864632.1 prephenate dehydrogenase [Dietzia cinnamea]MCT2029498.1 prephenate dehydrogenase [Dietzia cinnamea]MCT2033194.1 prephenate dehydrogenase [Dietzia cinnamea]MCT2061543.1 prephenate dehydrogenase [Dietzia cinnamea]MCT2076722.1 prephenate dehydrogenase [Dietzia cinnamea]
MRALGPERAFGWNRSAAGAEAATAAGFAVTTDLPDTLRRARESDALVVVAVPLPALDAVLGAVAEHAPGVALTDVISVKGPVLDAVRRHGLGARFVGGHPMAGTAHSGWDAGDPDLFRGATWLVAADPGADPDTWARVARLAMDSGARILSATSAEHDAAVARISHLGHVLAEALALAGGRGGDLALALAAGSFRDGTRVAGTAPDLVRAICEPNRDALLDVLDDCLADLRDARASLAERGTLGPLVDDGHRARRAYEEAQAGAGAAGEPVEVTPGAAGWLEELRAAGAAGREVRPVG